LYNSKDARCKVCPALREVKRAGNRMEKAYVGCHFHKSNAKRVAIRMTFTHYEEHLAPKWSEHSPQLKVFLDANFERDPVKIQLQPDKKEATYEVVVEGWQKGARMSDMAAMGLKSYVRSRNANGVECWVSGGADYINLMSVMEHLKAHGVFEKHIELRLHSVKNVLKGKILVTISRGDVTVGPGVKFVRLGYVKDCYVNGEYTASIAAEKSLEYIQATMEAKNNELREVDNRTTRIRVPAYLGCPGLELTNQTPLPAAAFVLGEVPKSNTLFWKNTVRVVMAREGWKVGDYNSLTRAEKCEVFKAAVCYVAQYMPYIGDTVDLNTRRRRYDKLLKHGCENFEGALEKGAGDCEDLEQAIMATVEALRSAQFDEKVSPALRDIKTKAFQYISAMSLDSVTSAAVTGADDKNAHLGAHMNLNLIPADYFKQCLERVDPEVSRKLPWGSIDMGDGKNLLKVAEGTGMYYSEAHIEGKRAVASYLYKESCFAVFKKPIMHEQGTHSPFYRDGLTLFVPEFARLGSNYVGFWYCNRDRYRGAKFEDMENRSVDVCIKAQPPVPKDVMAIAKEAIKIRAPPMKLVLTELSEDKIHTEAEKIVEAVESWGRRPVNSFPPVPLYITENLLTESVAEQVIRTLKHKKGVYAVEYSLEDVCDSLPVGVRFAFHADPTMDTAFRIE